jgi:hypothetical protein
MPLICGFISSTLPRTLYAARSERAQSQCDTSKVYMYLFPRGQGVRLKRNCRPIGRLYSSGRFGLGKGTSPTRCERCVGLLKAGERVRIARLGDQVKPMVCKQSTLPGRRAALHARPIALSRRRSKEEGGGERAFFRTNLEI